MQGLDLPVGLSAYTGAGQGAAGRGTAGRGAAGIGTATAGVNYVGMPMSYAFSTADNTRAGPSTPVRFRGTGARAWPELGMAVAPKIVAAGRGSADFSACASGAGDPVPLVRTATGTDNGAGQARRCTHRRCEGCYDLDAEKRVVRFCGGSSVDPNQYARWYASFGFVDGIEPAVVDGGLKVRQRQWHRGADIPRLILEGVSNDEKQNADADSQGARPDYEGERLGDGVEYRGITETGEERFIAHGEEVLVSRYDASVSEMRRDGPSRPQPGKGIPVPYATGESRILPIQTSERSDGESQETRGSSDDGKESFGEMVGLERERQEHGQVDGDNGERSGSDVSQGWIEPIAFVHRGSQKGGGMSEIEEGADGDDENYDADEEKEEGPGQHR
jgi:hypothetical protein